MVSQFQCKHQLKRTKPTNKQYEFNTDRTDPRPKYKQPLCSLVRNTCFEFNIASFLRPGIIIIDYHHEILHSCIDFSFLCHFRRRTAIYLLRPEQSLASSQRHWVFVSFVARIFLGFDIHLHGRVLNSYTTLFFSILSIPASLGRKTPTSDIPKCLRANLAMSWFTSATVWVQTVNESSFPTTFPITM